MIILFSIVFVRFSHVRFFLFYLDSSVAENFHDSPNSRKAGLQKSAIKEILRHKNEATTEDYIQHLASVADSLEVAEIFS